MKLIAQANSIEELLEAGINPGNYQELRAIDGKSFLGLIDAARTTIKNPLEDVSPRRSVSKTLSRFLNLPCEQRDCPFGHVAG